MTTTTILPSGIDLRPFPVNPDEGFPQSFRLSVADRVYIVRLYVNILEETLETISADAALELPMDGAHLVACIAREVGTEVEVLFQMRVVPGVVYETDDLYLSFSEIRIAPRNLNSPGAFGSIVKGGVAARWPGSSSGTA